MAVEASFAVAVFIIAFYQGLRLEGIVWDDIEALPKAHDAVVFGRQLFEESEGLVFAVLVVVHNAVLEQQRHPSVDDDGVHESVSHDFWAGSCRLVELVMVMPIVAGADIEKAAEQPDVGGVEETREEVVGADDKSGELADAQRWEAWRA